MAHSEGGMYEHGSSNFLELGILKNWRSTQDVILSFGDVMWTSHYVIGETNLWRSIGEQLKLQKAEFAPS